MENDFTQPEYSKSGSFTQLVLPHYYDVLIPEDDSVRLLSQILEELDYSKLHLAYSPLGRKPAVSPKNLFKVVIYGAMNHIFSSRTIEKSCRRDINFMYLLQGEPVPDHNTIARFKKDRLPKSIDSLFNQFTLLLQKIQEITFETLYVDGTKVEANANRYTFVWRKSIEKYNVKLMEKANLLLQTLFTDKDIPQPLTLAFMKDCLLQLEKEKQETNLTFVYGSGKRKTPLQRNYETLSEYIERKTYYEYCFDKFGDRNSFSKSDTDATFMRMKDDHMHNGQLKPAYNVQIGVEAEYVVQLGVYSSTTDYGTLVPFLNKVETAFKEKFKKIVADSGYESEENYVYLTEEKYSSFIKPQNHEIVKTKKFKKQIGRKENMEYDKERDEFTCSNRRKLVFKYDSTQKLKSGYERKLSTYECEDCSNCPLYEQCNKSKFGANKTLRFSKNFEALRTVSVQNISSKEGIKLRVNRSIQVEGAFGVLKGNYGVQRFLMRGFKNVEVEMTILCLGYNFNKLHNKRSSNRLKTEYHEVKIA